jgi:uncharacterized phage protein (TIGR02218 family)
MSYNAQETAIETGKPVELFLFRNLTDQFAYTSGPSNVLYNAVTYVPAQVDRPAPTAGVELETRDLTITIPMGDPLVNPRYITVPPSTPDHITIYRQHLTDGTHETITFWSGIIASVAFEGEFAKLSCRPVTFLFDRTIPKRTYSNLCAHVLYDRGCKLNDALFKDLVTVQTVNGADVTVVGTGIGLKPADYYLSGFARFNTIDYRAILKVVILNANTLTISFILPFENAGAGSEIELFAGCDHSMDTCFSKFNNVRNFGGFPAVPLQNPFAEGL